jgi:prepilin-type N-terminal cleavage/methylation domain-containing protein
MKLIKAFTLAEVLITLGIIGVVAAITIPNLISTYNKKVVETKLKEDYSLLQQVIRSHKANDIEIELNEDSLTNPKSVWETYFAPYMKYSQLCENEAGCWQSSGSVKNLYGTTFAYDDKEKGMTGGEGSPITIRLQNGTNLSMSVALTIAISVYFSVTTTNDDDYGLVIYIDANGDSPPNRVGKDIYILTYTQELGLVPAGYSLPDTGRNQDCRSNYSSHRDDLGITCLIKVMNNDWKIPNDIWNIK